MPDSFSTVNKKNRKSYIDSKKKPRHNMCMKIAYGYNRPTDAFDHVSPDQVFIDTDKTDREHRSDMIKCGLVEGDTLVLFARGDLAKGQALPIFEAKLSEVGVTISLIEAPEPMVATKTGRPVGYTRLDDLSEADDATLRAMWKDPLIYTPQYCIKWASERLGKPVRRWQLDYRYKKRSDAKQALAMPNCPEGKTDA